ncbi:MAG: hypothetical protein SFU98_22445 [Leptospiraceae bacterium]|nr:hypothetical protein [Leptospiraceae bacterium]
MQIDEIFYLLNQSKGDKNPLKSFCICIILLFILFLSCNQTTNRSESNLNLALILRALSKSSTGNTRTTNVPSRISVNIPSSLKSSATNARRTLSIPKFSDLKTVSAPKADGYLAINSAIEKFSKLANDVAFEMLIIDQIISRAKASEGTCVPGGTLKINVTQKMLDLVLLALEETGLTPSEALEEIQLLQEEGELPVAGTTIPSPAMIYKKQTIDFNHQLLYSFSSNLSVSKSCPSNNRFTKAIKFTDDFSKISFGHEETIKAGFDILIMSGNVTLETNTNGKKRVSFLNNYKIDTTSYSNLLIMDECSKGDTSGDCLVMEQLYREDDSLDPSKDLVYKTKARVNDSGGLIEFTQKNTSSGITEEERELFDKEGNLIGYEIKSGGIYIPSPSYPHLDINLNNISYDEHGLELEFSSIKVTLSGCNSVIANFDIFVIAQEGMNPDIDPTALIGTGFRDSSFDIDYWGSESEISTSRIWKYDHNSATYTETISTCKLIKN